MYNAPLSPAQVSEITDTFMANPDLEAVYFKPKGRNCDWTFNKKIAQKRGFYEEIDREDFLTTYAKLPAVETAVNGNDDVRDADEDVIEGLPDTPSGQIVKEVLAEVLDEKFGTNIKEQNAKKGAK